MSHRIWTIGHSTRPIKEFLDLLRAHDIGLLVDVRTVPRSRHNPHFNTDVLPVSLRTAGIQYRHMPSLGGLRKPKKDSTNQGWRNASFRGYADYMQTVEFLKGLDELMASSESQRIAIMCAEAVPWRCHRSMIADALVSCGWTVLHLMSEKRAEPHELTSIAKVSNGRLTYPSPDGDVAPRLF